MMSASGPAVVRSLVIDTPYLLITLAEAPTPQRAAKRRHRAEDLAEGVQS